MLQYIQRLHRQVKRLVQWFQSCIYFTASTFHLRQSIALDRSLTGFDRLWNLLITHDVFRRLITLIVAVHCHLIMTSQFGIIIEYLVGSLRKMAEGFLDQKLRPQHLVLGSFCFMVWFCKAMQYSLIAVIWSCSILTKFSSTARGTVHTIILMVLKSHYWENTGMKLFAKNGNYFSVLDYPSSKLSPLAVLCMACRQTR